MAKKYTRDEVSEAVNTAVVLVQDGIQASDRDIDLINLMVNVSLTALDNPDATLDQAIAANYEASPAVVRSWIE